MAERAAVETAVGRPVTDFELASYLMYPRVFLKYAAERLTFGDVSVLPTSVFFYGMQPGQEIDIVLERGRTLVVRYISTSDADQDGIRTVLFELNGQARPILVADRHRVAKQPLRQKAESGNPDHIGAPLAATIRTVPARVGQRIAPGTPLLTLEAMKLETTVRAEREGLVKEVLAKPGQIVDAHDLLIVLEP
jgi:pyruvate carboxylase